MATGLLDGLNNAQREAITAGDGPVLVLAGPGSGKTRVLTHRIAYLIRDMGVHPSAIIAVTFTNKAAGEMKARVENLLGDKLRGLQIGTFHAICARILRKESSHTDRKADYLIYDTDDQISVVTQALNELNVDTKKFKPRQILNNISAAKNELVTPEKYSGPGYMGEIVRRAYTRYQELLIASNARDFDDLLMDTVMLFKGDADVRERYQKFYEYLLVDEFQDTNFAQYELVKLLAKPQNNVFVVGDEDQAIYGFRGADYRNVLQFKRDYPEAKVVLLEQNYRSTQIVLDAARSIIDKNNHRTPKALFTERLGGNRVTIYEAYSEGEEADFVAKQIEKLKKQQDLDWKDFAVMYRTNAQSRALEDVCIKEGIPYKLVGGVGFYKRREIRDLLAYLRLVNNGDDVVSFNRVINVPKRGIGKKSVEDFQKWATKKKLSTSAALEALKQGEASTLGPPAVKKFVEFANLLDHWREVAAQNDLTALLDDIIVNIGYTLYLRDEADSDEEFTERDSNVKELRGLMSEQKEKPLNEFLEEIALVADVDTVADDFNAVTLLTLHAAKGLEYPIVFITGLEEGLLPHFRSLDEPDGVEEERRLMYVGLTRAMQQLYLSYAFRRTIFGDSTPSIPSRFLSDIPARLTEGATARTGLERDMKRYSFETQWGQEEEREQPLTERQAGIRSKIAAFGSAPQVGPQLKYKTGLRVFHSKFGEGVVIESRRSGSDEEVTVSFRDHGIKRLAASFANLVVLEG
jgi:DNA helicase-2/ATP-dependent DNA helicase PcrA